MSDDSPQRPEDPRTDGEPRPAAEDVDPSGAAADDAEPTRFRVADTGWPPASGPAGPALPRRTPGASGGPGGLAAPGDDEQDAPEPAREPADDGPAGLTSPPLDEEPWAGLPPAAPVEAPAPADAEPQPATEADGPPDAAAGAGPEAVAVPPADAGADVDAPARTSGRHRGPKGRRGEARAGGGHGTRARGRASRPAPGWPLARLVLLALAVVAAIVMGVLTIVTRVWPGPPGNPYTSTSTRAAVAAASAVAGPILSYDYTTIDKKAAQLAPLQTATCASQYQHLITTTVKPLAVQNKATQKATVLAAGVSSATSGKVTVLAFMQLTSTNSVKPGKEINEAQLSVTMVKQHGKWLLAGTAANGSGAGATPSCGGATATGK